CAYGMLVRVHQELGETNAERQGLTQWAERDDEAPEAYVRLMELAAEAEDWRVVAQNAERYLGVDPLVPIPYRWLTRSAEKTGEADVAINSYLAILQLDVPDASQIHYNLARLLQ